MKKILQRVGCISILILIFFLALFFKWQAITYYVLGKAAQYYAAQENMSLEISWAGGNPLTETTIGNLLLRPLNGQPQAFIFKAESLTCTYNIWDLKEGHDRFLQGLSCSAASPYLAYDLNKVEKQKEQAGQPGLPVLPAAVPVPRLAVHNGALVLTGSGWGAEVKAINADLQSKAAGPEMNLKADRLLFSQDGIVRVDSDFASRVRYTNKGLIVESLEFGEEQISVSGTIGLSRFAEGYLEFASELVFAESSVSLSGSMENKLLKAHTFTETFDVGELQKRLGGSGWGLAGNIKGEADFTYNFAGKTDMAGSFSLGLSDGLMHGTHITSASLIGGADSESLNVSFAELRMPGNHILVRDAVFPMARLQSGDVLNAAGNSGAFFEIAVHDFAAFLKLFKLESDVLPGSLRPDSMGMNGRLENGAVYLDHALAETPESSLTINKTVIPIPATLEEFETVPINMAASYKSSNIQETIAGFSGDFPLKGRVDADLTLTGSMKDMRGLLAVTGEDIVHKEKKLGKLALRGEIRASQEKPGTFNSLQLAVNDLTLVNDSGTLSLFEPATAAWQTGRLLIDAVLQSGEKGKIAIEIETSSGKEVSGKFTTNGLDSEGWLKNYIEGSYFFRDADIEIQFTGLPQNPQVQLNGSFGAVGGNQIAAPVSASIALHYSAKGMEISDLVIQSHEKNQLTLTGFLPYDPLAQSSFLDGEMSLKGYADIPALADLATFLAPLSISKGSLVMDMDISGSWKQPLGHITFKAEGIAPPELLREYSDLPLTVTCDISADPDFIVLEAGSLVSGDYSVQASGSWQHGYSIKELVQKRFTELRGEVSADIAVNFKSLNFLKKKLAWVRRFDGNTQVKLKVSGAMHDPVLRGSFVMQDGELSHTFNFPILSAINLQGEFDRQSLAITGLKGEMGGAPISLNGRVNRAQQGDIDVNFVIKGENVLLFRNNDMRMRGNVQLEVTGQLESLMVKGTTGLTGGNYTKNIDFLGKIGASSVPVSKGGDFLFSFQERPLQNAVLDIKINTIEPFRIRNNLVRGTLRPELTLKGTGELPFLVGTIYIDPSRVLLPSGRLQVQSGLIRFLESDPDRPQIDLLASSKVLDYDINVVTQGPVDDPVITLSSSPALPNDDLLLLLLTGQIPRQDTAPGKQGTGSTKVMVYLGRDFLSKWLEEDFDSGTESILDRIELDYGRGVTKSGEQTIESTFRLSELHKEKKRVFYLSGEKDRYDAFNYGLRAVFRFE